MMTRVLFVCLGNICRSPMAEAVFRELATQAGLEKQLVIESRATSHWEGGKAPHHGTQAKLVEHGISCQDMISEQIQHEDFADFDVIIGMDRQNVKDLKRMAPVATLDKIKLFLSVLPENDYQEVPDPYYTGDFDLTYELVKAGSEQWLSTIIGQ